MARGRVPRPLRRRAGRRDPARPGRRALRVLRLALDGRLDLGGAQPRARRLLRAAPARCLTRSLSTEQLARHSGSSSLWSSCAGLAVAVLALAREVGMLRLRLGPASALEIPRRAPSSASESRSSIASPGCGTTASALAVFTSEGCRVCRGLAPAIASLARRPGVAVEVFDEVVRRGRLGGATRSPAARSRSRSTPTAPCSPRGPSTTWRSSRASLGTASRRRANLDARYD